MAVIRRQVDKKQKFLKRINEGMADEDQSNLKSVFETIRKTEVEVEELKEKLAKVEKRASVKAVPLTAESVKVLLEDLRGLLREDVGAAAPALAALTGPVVVTQEIKETGGETEWKARFKLNAVPILVDLARRRSCPTAGALELLNTGGWAFGNAVKVWLQHTPKYEMLASQATALEAEGASVDQIAAQLKTTWDTANKALAFGKAGGVTPTKVLPPRVKKGKTIATEIIKEIVRLHDVEMRSFSSIAVKLGIDHSTVTRNYKRAKQDGKKTRIPKRGDRKGGRYTFLPKEIFERMEKMLAEGVPMVKIAEELKCGRNTVVRHRDRMKERQ